MVQLRHLDSDRLDALEQLVASTIAKEAERQRCSASISRSFAMPSCTFSPDLQNTIERTAADTGLKSARMRSEAFHDALFVNRVAPASMIFVPYRGGLSHNEAEFIEAGRAAAGCQVLAQAVVSLVGQMRR